MVEGLKRALRGWTPVHDALAAAIAVGYGVLFLWPVAFWFDAGEVFVRADGNGRPVVIFTGGTKRDFLGSYSVIVRDVEKHQVACDATSAAFNYTTKANYPDTPGMDWWAPGDPRCQSLPPSAYTMETCWTIHSPFFGLVPNKTICRSSNIFEIPPPKIG